MPHQGYGDNGSDEDSVTSILPAHRLQTATSYAAFDPWLSLRLGWRFGLRPPPTPTSRRPGEIREDASNTSTTRSGGVFGTRPSITGCSFSGRRCRTSEPGST